MICPSSTSNNYILVHSTQLLKLLNSPFSCSFGTFGFANVTWWSKLARRVQYLATLRYKLLHGQTHVLTFGTIENPIILQSTTLDTLLIRFF